MAQTEPFETFLRPQLEAGEEIERSIRLSVLESDFRLRPFLIAMICAFTGLAYYSGGALNFFVPWFAGFLATVGVNTILVSHRGVVMTNRKVYLLDVTNLGKPKAVLETAPLENVYSGYGRPTGFFDSIWYVAVRLSRTLAPLTIPYDRVVTGDNFPRTDHANPFVKSAEGEATALLLRPSPSLRRAARDFVHAMFQSHRTQREPAHSR